MPVRRVAQPLWLLVSAAWPGGAAVAMEAQSRRAAGVGRGGAGLGLRPMPLGSLADAPRIRSGPAGVGSGPWQALPPSSPLHPAEPALLDIKALCQRMRSCSQACPLGWASGRGHRESALDVPHRVGSLHSGGRLPKTAKPVPTLSP